MMEYFGTKHIVGIASITMLLVLLAAQSAGQVQVGPNHAALMERKLESTQKILENIARSDMEGIAKQSQILHMLSQEAGWNVIQTPEYMRLSDSFRATTSQLRKAAKDENMDAVGLAYVKLTISCIDCHRYTKLQQSSSKGEK